MMKFVLNRAGVRELLKSSEMAGAVREAGKRVQANAGDGYSMNVQMKNRAVCRVYAYTREAVRQNYRNNTLLKALR